MRIYDPVTLAPTALGAKHPSFGTREEKLRQIFSMYGDQMRLAEMLMQFRVTMEEMDDQESKEMWIKGVENLSIILGDVSMDLLESLEDLADILRKPSVEISQETPNP